MGHLFTCTLNVLLCHLVLSKHGDGRGELEVYNWTYFPWSQSTACPLNRLLLLPLFFYYISGSNLWLSRASLSFFILKFQHPKFLATSHTGIGFWVLKNKRRRTPVWGRNIPVKNRKFMGMVCSHGIRLCSLDWKKWCTCVVMLPPPPGPTESCFSTHVVGRHCLGVKSTSVVS